MTFCQPATGVTELVAEAGAVDAGAVDARFVSATVVSAAVGGSGEVVPASETEGAVVVDDDEPSEHAAITPNSATAIAAARFT